MALQVDGLEFVSLEDGIDTRTTASRGLYLFLACLVIFEQDRRRERRHRRLVAARVWNWGSGSLQHSKDDAPSTLQVCCAQPTPCSGDNPHGRCGQAVGLPVSEIGWNTYYGK